MSSRLIEKDVAGLKLKGFSAAGEESIVIVPDFNLAFDVGRAPREIIAIDHVCLTHGHMDHAAGLAYYFSQRHFQGIAPGTAIVPKPLVGPIEDLMKVWGRIEGHLTPIKLIGVDEDEDVEIRRGLIVRPFRVKHRAQSLGYAVIEVRKKLKPEYAELSGRQLADLKRKGETIENRLEIPLLAYCGDTALASFLDYDHVRNAQVLITECTFFDRDHLPRARQGQHTHVQDLPELMQRVNNPNVVLTHFTNRTGIVAAKRAIEGVLSDVDRQRITILMDRPRRPRPHRV